MRFLERWSGEGRTALHGAEALFAGLPEPALWLDARLRLRDANAPLRRALGPAQPIRPGMPVDRLFVPQSRPGLLHWLQGGADAPELRLMAPEGQPGHPVAAQRIRLPEGDCVLLLQDMMPRQALAARVAEADRLQALGTLAGGIAHDFNNLLGVVLGATEDAQRHPAILADPGLAAELSQVQAAAQRGAGLVRQMLAYARQQVLAPRRVALNAAVEGLASLLERPLLAEGIQLHLDLDTPGREVLIDASELDRVLMNLAMNARQAMRQGGRLTLRTSRTLLLHPQREGAEDIPPGRWTVLEVADTGHGIPPAILPRIFEPFFTGRGQQGGTGLGLATVHGIVRQSGGYVSVRSSPQGTCFRLLLPRLEAVEAPEVVAPPVTLPERAPSVTAPPAEAALLLVEDEAPLRRLAERALQRAGWRVLVAEDAEAALALLESSGESPALLVSDVVMPGIDGASLARQLQQRFPAMPALLVSGYAPSMVAGGLSGAALHFLAKPYAPAELVARVGGILGAGKPVSEG